MSFSKFRKNLRRCTVPQQIDPPTSMSAPPIIGISQTWRRWVLNRRSSIFAVPLRRWVRRNRSLATARQLCVAGRSFTRLQANQNGMTEWSDSSKLSPYLALGLISPRSIYTKSGPMSTANCQSVYLLATFRVLWREYFRAGTLFGQSSLSSIWD